MSEGARADGSGPCNACLRRGALIGRLAPLIAAGRAAGRMPHGSLGGRSDAELAAMLDRAEPAALAPRDNRLGQGGPGRRTSEGAGESICRHSPAYPARLLQLADPPAVIHCRGGLDRLAVLAERPAVTIVGGRAATSYALGVATTLGHDVAAAGATVVSGLALGIDAAAHRGATSAGAGALAVLASGADVAYPRTNAGLYRRVVETGAVISEMPPGTPPARWAFPARNRIMAALGSLTVVVEARERSGSLITARLATDLGREIGAVPGRVTTDQAEGSNRLLQDGATVVLDADGVLDSLFGPGRDASGGLRSALSTHEGGERATAVSELDPPIRRVLEALDSERGIDAIGRAAGVPAGLVRAALGRLELLGLATRDGLGRYERTPGR